MVLKSYNFLTGVSSKSVQIVRRTRVNSSEISFKQETMAAETNNRDSDRENNFEDEIDPLFQEIVSKSQKEWECSILKTGLSIFFSIVHCNFLTLHNRPYDFYNVIEILGYQMALMSLCDWLTIA